MLDVGFFWSAATVRICPCSLYSRRSEGPPQAPANMARARQKPTEMRIGVVYSGQPPARNRPGRRRRRPPVSQGIRVRADGCPVLNVVASHPGIEPMIWIGTSGYNYPEWKGAFTPPTCRRRKCCRTLPARFPTVEINYTFYRMPTEKLVAGWAAQTPSPYRLTLKAPRRISHDSRLRNCAELSPAFAAPPARLATSWVCCCFSCRRT